jgi:membrane-associated protease RseP (regulator of RpoE activity)
MSYRVLALAALALTPGNHAAAQGRPAAAPSCAGGASAVGHLGYSGLSCNCTHFYDETNPDASVWRFRGEPRIEGVKRGGPAEGKLRRGDLVVAIDGALITSDEGGRRFAQLEPGLPVTLTVRRDGRDLTVEITPDATCPPEAPAPPRAVPAAPTPPAVGDVRPRVAPAPPVKVRSITVPPAPPAPKLGSRGWLGFSLTCSHCGMSYQDSAVVWSFSEPPVVERVEPEGPAARAGLRDGDRITHIDDGEITTARAGARFGAIEPGEQVVLRIRRDGEGARIAFTAEEPRKPGLITGRRSGLLTPAAPVERFTGTIGDALVQVTGGVVSVTQTDDEIVIRSAEITVRIRRAGR